MDSLLHTAIALSCMVGCYYAGHFFAKKNMFEPIISNMLDRLESDGYIYTKTDEDGEKELIPISEIIAKTLREATKAAKWSWQIYYDMIHWWLCIYYQSIIQQQISFTSNSTIVSTTNNTITLSSRGLSTGDPVYYYAASNINNIL